MRPVSISLSLYISTANIRPNQVSHSHVLAPSVHSANPDIFLYSDSCGRSLKLIWGQFNETFTSVAIVLESKNR